MMKYYSDSHCGYLEQAALAQFIQEGHYARHVRKIRKICYERQNTFISANHYLPHLFNVQMTDSGIHTVCWVKDGYDINVILTNAVCWALAHNRYHATVFKVLTKMQFYLAMLPIVKTR